MQVLEKGRKQTGWAKEFHCTGAGNGGGGCGARLLVERPDIFLTYKNSYDGSSERFQTFRCKDCGVETDFTDTLPFTPPDKKTWIENKANERDD